MTEATNLSPVEQIVMLPIEQLRESPFNSRKKYNEATLAEMAETMKPPHGRIHSPLVVRPLEQQDLEYTHELVFGHRRRRAALLAGLSHVPVIVRDMANEEARVAQLIENAQREDITALEEADSLLELRRIFNVSIEEMMSRTGKGRRHVFSMLKLASAHDELRKAVEDGTVGGELGRILATVPNPLQPKALVECTTYAWSDDLNINVRRGISTRRAKEIVNTRYRLKLVAAPFDQADANLVESTPACTGCPKNSDNEATLLEDCGAGMCTDPDCWNGKLTAHGAKILAKAKSKGHPIIRAADATELLVSTLDNEPTGYFRLDEQSKLKSVLGVDLTFGDLLENMGKKAPKPTAIEHPHRPGIVLSCITEAQADEALKANGGSLKRFQGEPEDDDEENGEAAQPFPVTDSAGTSHQQRQIDKRNAEAEAVAAMSPTDRALHDPATWIKVRGEAMARVARQPRVGWELLWVVLTELALAGDFGEAEVLLGWEVPDTEDEDFDPAEWRRKKVMAMDCDQLAQLLVMVTIERSEWIRYNDTTENKVAQRREVAALYGIDPLNPTGQAEPEAAAEPEDDEEDGVPAYTASKPKKPARYRNKATGETWNGRGLQPKWLKAAISAGARLEDFEVGTAAQAPAPASQEQMELGGLEQEEAAA